jgi:methylase of polypeptide subunit release factors
MVALNRLTGHSPGFFSAYTLPPNQAVSVESQRKINRRLGQKPEQKNISELILRKSRVLLRDFHTPAEKNERIKKAKLFICSADSVLAIRSNTVQLVVTSPPFLDVVDYVSDNWVRAWFAGVDLRSISVWQFKKIEEWKAAMGRVFDQLHRVLKPGGYVAFEVGEVRNGKIKLEESIAEVGSASGLRPLFVLVNQQNFTKTSNCWGVSNLKKGTNTNRVVVFRKPT